MKQRLALLLICLIFHPAAVPNRHSRYYQSNGKDVPKSAVSVSGQPTRQAQAANGDQETPNRYSPVWAEWGLVVVGFLTLLGVWKQARGTRRAADKTEESVREIRDQTRVLERQTKSIHHQAVQVRKQTAIFRESADAARTAAETARDNVNAFINSEKAWLKAERYRIDMPPLTDPMEPYPTYYVPIPIKNFGRTVAQVSDAYANSGVYSPLPDVPRCPAHPPYAPIIVPGESWNLHAPVPSGWVDSIRKGIERRGLYIYGFVKYRDIGDDPRECWFCYIYRFRDPRDPTMSEGFYVCGNAPDAYTKCT